MINVDASLQIPKNVKKGKEVKVNIGKQHIKVELIEPTGLKTLIDSDLPWPIRAEDSTWSLVPGEHIHVGDRSMFKTKHSTFV